MKKLITLLPLLALACSPSVRYVDADALSTVMAKCGVEHNSMSKTWLACVEADVATGLNATPNQVNYSNGVISIMESANALVDSASKRRISRSEADKRLTKLVDSVIIEENQAALRRDIRRNTGATIYGGTGWGGRYGRGSTIGSGWRF